MWNDATGYEQYVGHWSRAVAPRFLDWLGLRSGLCWLDVACGTGSLTQAILASCGPSEIVGLDASANYVAFAERNCTDSRVHFIIGDANALPFPSASFDVSVSGLALNFIEFDRSLAQQYRVVRPGGTVAAFVWDYAGEYEFARRFWDTALSLDPRASAYDPGRKYAICSEENLREAFIAAGCTWVETCSLDHWNEFESREAYWRVFDTRQGSTAEYFSILTDQECVHLRDAVLSTMPPEGPVKLKVRALAAKGIVQIEPLGSRVSSNSGSGSV